jgi:flagellar motor switch protein FliG
MPKVQRQIAPSTAGELAGADKATALLLVMGKPLATRIVKQLADNELRLLARSATGLPAIGLDKVGRLVVELELALGSTGTVAGSSQGAHELITGSVGEEIASEIMDELAGAPPKKIWSRLAEVANERLAAFLAAEEPQVATFVLSNLDVEKASAVLETLEAGSRADLSARLLSLRPIGDAAARLVADRLGEELLGETTANVGRHARLGAILNQLHRETAADVLGRLEAKQPDDARKVRQYVFAFEDIARLAPEDRGKLLDQVPAERVVLALRECEPALRSAILAALAPRARRLVEAELANSVKAPAKSIAEARRAIAGLALALAEKSVIRLPSAADGQAIDTHAPGEAGA